MWVRVDNRLVHGQVVETWLPYTGLRNLLVANSKLADDDLQQQIMALAVPNSVQITFTSLDSLQDYAKEHSEILDDTLVLFANCQDARAALEDGFQFSVLNVANQHYAEGKRQVCRHIALSDDDADCLTFFKTQDVTLDFRCVPNDTTQLKEW